MSLFAVSKQVVVLVENRLLGAQDIPWPISWIRKEFWHPIIYVQLGLDFLIKNFIKTTIYIVLFVALTAYLSSRVGVSSEQLNVNIAAAIMGAVFVVLFTLPSTFVSFGIKDTDLVLLIQHIQENVASKDELEALRDNLETMEKCVVDRVTTLRWAMATIWGVILFGFSQSVGVLTRLAEKDEVGNLIGGSVFFFVVSVLLAFIPLIAIAGYRRANNMVFRGLQFARNEVALKFTTLPEA